MLLDALEKACPNFEKLHAIASENPNAQPLFVSSSRGKPRKSLAASSDISQLHSSDEEEEEEENVDATPKQKSKEAKPTPTSAANPFSKFDYKRSRGNKPLGFGDSLYYSNELKFLLQEKKFEMQERERAKEREEDARRWEAKFVWEREEAERRHAETMEQLRLQMKQMELQMMKLELELEAMKKK